MELQEKAAIIGEIRLIRTGLGMNQTQFGRLIYPELPKEGKSAGNKVSKIENGKDGNDRNYIITLDRAKHLKAEYDKQAKEHESARQALLTGLNNETNNDKSKGVKTDVWGAQRVCERLDRLIKAIEGVTNAIYVTDKRKREETLKNEE